LINGVVWARYNVDAPGTFAATPESYGMFYQWSRPKAWPAFNIVEGWDSTYPEDDVWEEANDPSPAGWRVPALSEIQTLFDTTRVSNEWTKENGVTGIKFTDKATGNTLFLRAAGLRKYDGGNQCGAGSDGFYWSSTCSSRNLLYLCLHFNYSGGRWSSRSRPFSINSNGVLEWLDTSESHDIFSVRSVAE
jgi:uncharacterized protein (TIGR02145 family)